MYLDVGGVLVGLVGGRLQLLADPGLDLVHVAAELLQRLGLAQLGALLDHLGLQAKPPVERGVKRRRSDHILTRRGPLRSVFHIRDGCESIQWVFLYDDGTLIPWLPW